MINNDPKIKSQSKRFTNAYFFYKENKRNKILEKSQSLRNVLMKNPKMSLNYPLFSQRNFNSTSNPLLPMDYNKNKNLKNITDFWNFRYDKEKENEQIYFSKKQNLSQIKNLIDETLKLREKGKYKKHEKYVKKSEEKNLMKKEYVIKKDKEIKQREKMKKEIDKINKKKKEKEFNNERRIKRKTNFGTSRKIKTKTTRMGIKEL